MIGFVPNLNYISSPRISTVGVLTIIGMWLSSMLTRLSHAFFISNKAIVNGAVLSHVNRRNHIVSSRIACATYGLVCAMPVKVNDIEHIRREQQWERDPAGDCYAPDHFGAKHCKVSLLVSVECDVNVKVKGAKVHEGVEFRESFSLTERDLSAFGEQTMYLVCYRGNISKPEWVDRDACKFFTFFVLRYRSDTNDCSGLCYTLYDPCGPKPGSQGSGSQEAFRQGHLPTRF